MFLVYQCPTRRNNTICLTKLCSFPDPPTLPRTVLKDLLEFATKKSQFTFDGHYYDQIDGVAMGSLLGHIFMCHFEESWLTNNQSGRPFGLDTLMTLLLSSYLTVKTPLPDF